MIEILPESQPNAVAVMFSGRLTEDDRQRLDGELYLRADRDEEIDLLLDLREVEGLDADTLRAEFDVAERFSDDIRRLAIVTDGGAWEGIVAILGTPVGRALGIEVARFEDRPAAWEWFTVA